MSKDVQMLDKRIKPYLGLTMQTAKTNLTGNFWKVSANGNLQFSHDKSLHLETKLRSDPKSLCDGF